MENTENLPDHIRRRVVFLLNEALLNSPRDQVVTYCMRVLSNYATVGFDSGSYKIKITNKRVSRKAETLLKNSKSLKDWSEECINEHEIPLKEIWEWLCSDASRLSPEDVWSKFLDSKMVTVTKEEDKKLNSSGLRSKSGVLGRYSCSGIEIVDLEFSPNKLFGEKFNN